MLAKKPSNCEFMDGLLALHVPEISKAVQEVLAGMWECSDIKDRQSMIGVLQVSMIPACVAPCWYFFMTLTLWTSLFCTDRLYKLYVRFIIKLFNAFQDKIQPVLFNGLKKPTDHSVATIVHVSHRIWYFPYLIVIIFFTFLAFFAGIALKYQQYSWGFLLMLFVYQTYFQVMVWIYGAEHTLVKILMAELRRRYFEAKDVRDSGSMASTSYAKRTEERDSHLRPHTDLWLRLFYNKNKTVALSCMEISMIVRYFEDNHYGLERADNSFVNWPISWHDDLRLTGNGLIDDVYIEDLNILLSTADAGSAGSADQLLDSPFGDDEEGQRFIEKVYRRLCRLYEKEDT